MRRLLLGAASDPAVAYLVQLGGGLACCTQGRPPVGKGCVDVMAMACAEREQTADFRWRPGSGIRAILVEGGLSSK